MKAKHKLCNKQRFFALPIYQGVTVDKVIFLHYNPFIKEGFAKPCRNKPVYQ